MRVQRCKGSRDLSPADMVKFRLIEKACSECCLKWGYEEIKTPTLEYLHLFTATGTLTPGMLGKVYSFLDWDGWSGERVVLRPDGTIPAVRFYIDSIENSHVAKLFYVTNVFMFDETGKKNRERWQCGTELIGATSPTADVELIMLVREILDKLGLKDAELKLSHAGLIRALLAELGLSGEEQNQTFDRILDGEREALTEIKALRPELESYLTTILDMKGKSAGFLKNLKALAIPNLPGLETHLDNFISIASLLETLGCEYEIDIASGRGFEYYTGILFQFFAGEEKLGGGGRYDALIPLMGGKDTPASGFALYFDRLMQQLNSEAIAQSLDNRILVRTKSDQPELISKAYDITSQLHDAGYVAELHLGGQESADFRWRLDIQPEAPEIVLTDQAKRKKFKPQTTDEILELLAH